MNRRAMPTPSRLIASVLAPLMLLSSCGGPGGPAERPPLEGAAIGGPFTLTDKDGKTVRYSDFDGKFRMVYFGYTFCPDVCPVDVQQMMLGYNRFVKDHPEMADQIQPIFITVDPARDTPAVVGEFAAAFSPRLIGLSGSAEQVKAAADQFRVFYSRGATSPAGGYLMDHSRIAYLMDREGQPLATLPVDAGGEAVAAELAKWTM